MMPCNDILLTVLLRGPLDTVAATHLQACPRCREEEPAVRALAAALAAGTAPEPPPGLDARMRAVVAPALQANARALIPPDWRRVAGALAVALLPLPLIVFADVTLLRALHAGLQVLLPVAVSGYLVSTYAATVTLALAASYAAVPLLAGRPLEERHV